MARDETPTVVIGDGDELRNIDVVRSLCRSWASGDPEQVVAHFTDDMWFRGRAELLGVEAIKGKQTFLDLLRGPQSVLKTFAMTSEADDTFARGSLVVCSHYQTFTSKEDPREVRDDWYLGCYFFRGGKIQEWNDYPLIPYHQARREHPPGFGRFLRAEP
jgi:ketosteroid isomerase-like protein